MVSYGEGVRTPLQNLKASDSHHQVPAVKVNTYTTSDRQENHHQSQAMLYEHQASTRADSIEVRGLDEPGAQNPTKEYVPPSFLLRRCLSPHILPRAQSPYPVVS
jgi:hypothetical protein